jgi:hypothetical protein
MKKALFLLFVAAIYKNTEAQLFKKLKEKAQQAIEGKPKTSSSNNDNNNSNATEEPKQEENKTTTKQKNKWIPTPDCEKIFTLEDGESFMYDESTVFTTAGKLTTSFLIQTKKYNYFIIENGQRSAEYKMLMML